MQAENIVQGFNLAASAFVKIGNYGSNEAACADLGRTDGGVSLVLDRDVKIVETDQDIAGVAAKETKRVHKIKFKLAEATLENLAVAMNLPTTALAGGVLSLGSVDADGELYRALYLNVDGPNGATRKYWFPKCVIIGNASHEYKKDEHSKVEIEVQILWDSTQAAGQELGTFADTGADATPPTVALSVPADGGTVVQGAKGTVTWLFTEANVMDASTMIYGKTVMIVDDTTPSAAVLKAGTIVYDSVLKQLTFTPTDNWTTVHTFQAIITSGVKDQAGNAVAAPKIEQFSAT
jgi:hypothetical protein